MTSPTPPFNPPQIRLPTLLQYRAQVFRAPYRNPHQFVTPVLQIPDTDSLICFQICAAFNPAFQFNTPIPHLRFLPSLSLILQFHQAPCHPQTLCLVPLHPPPPISCAVVHPSPAPFLQIRRSFPLMSPRTRPPQFSPDLS